MKNLSQFAPLVHLPSGTDSVSYLQRSARYDEAVMQDLVFRYPEVLPINEIDPTIDVLFPVCTEMETESGSVDALFATPSGVLAVTEFKLWRNPEARRKVVGQILDYAKDLARWSYEDLQSEVSRRLGRPGNVLYELAAELRPNLDEAGFVDAVSTNLKLGRFLLLVVGDGIREGVEAIVQFMQDYARLEFTFGLIEAAVYDLPNGDRLLQARALARTKILNRNVIRLELASSEIQESDPTDMEVDAADSDSSLSRQFWAEVLGGLKFSDPRLEIRGWKNKTTAWVWLTPNNDIWVLVSIAKSTRKLRVAVARYESSIGADAFTHLRDEAYEELRVELGEELDKWVDSGRLHRLGFRKDAKGLVTGEGEDAIDEEDVAWMRDRFTRLVNAVAPRINKWAASQE